MSSVRHKWNAKQIHPTKKNRRTITLKAVHVNILVRVNLCARCKRINNLMTLIAYTDNSTNNHNNKHPTRLDSGEREKIKTTKFSWFYMQIHFLAIRKRRHSLRIRYHPLRRSSTFELIIHSTKPNNNKNKTKKKGSDPWLYSINKRINAWFINNKSFNNQPDLTTYVKFIL